MPFQTKEEAHDAMAAARAEWVDAARATARQLGSHGGLVNVDDVRALCPPPPDADPRCMGVIFLKSEWDRVGYINSKRKTCHKRPIAQFRLAS